MRCVCRMLVLYKEPLDKEHFERHYRAVHIPLVRAMPGLKAFDVSYGGVDVSFPDLQPYLVALLDWETKEAMASSLSSDLGQRVIDDLKIFAKSGFLTLAYMTEDMRV